MRHKIIYSLLILLIGCVKSNPVPTTPPTPVVTIPNAPTDLKGALMSTTQIDLTWTDASNNEDGFKIERKSGTDAFSLIATLGQNVVTYSDKAFTLGPTYSYRVYSYNTKGNSSNTNEVSIVTLGVPTLSTKSIADTTAINALTGGTITSDGGGQVTARGVVWSTSTNPTIALSTKTVDSLGVGGYNSFITGLTANTKYYVRAYATNAAGTGYGNEISFTTNTINIPNGLVAYYPFTGNAGDSSGNGNHGILVGGVSLTSDRFNKIQSAYSFDGKTGYIDVPSLNKLPYRPITYSSWIWINSYLPTNLGFQFRSIVGRNTSFILNTGEIGLYAGLGILDNTLIMWRGGGQASGLIPSSKVVPLINSWIFVTYTHNVNGDWRWFINGSLTNSGNDKDSQDYYNYFRIGGNDAFDRNYGRWDGKIDDLRVYNRPLTAAEITYLYNH